MLQGMSAAETLDAQPGSSSAQLAHQLRAALDELAAERAELDKIVKDLADAHRMQAVLERDKAVAEAQARQLERQLEHARLERSLLSSRMATLMQQRDQALQAMTWWSRRRYARLNRARATHPSQPETSRR